MKSQRIIAVALAVGVLSTSLLTGCGSKNSAATSTDTVATSTAASDTTAATPDEMVTIRTTIQTGELPEELIKKFESENQNINVEVVTADAAKLLAMIASGTAPDAIRTQAREIPTYVTRGLALNIDSYMQKSQLIKKDDLLPAANGYRWDGQKQGEGPYYGLPKDFSPDMGLWINKKLFNAAGVAIPDPKTPLTYAKVEEYAKKLTKKDASGKIEVYGFLPSGTIYDTNIASALLQLQGKALYSTDFKTPFFNTPENISVMKWAVDFAKSGAVSSPLNQTADWYGPMFMNEKAAMVQSGYWFSGSIRSGEQTKTHLDDFMYLPAPQWAEGQSTRYSPVTGATGVFILKQTEHPDEAFKFFEWFVAGEPSEARAKSGWGLPIWKSKLALIPQETNFDKQCYAVVQDEINNMGASLVFNPYLNPSVVDAEIDKVLAPVYFGKDTVENAAAELDKQIKLLISEGMEIAGVK